jgi:hypothetical protein
VHRSVPQTTVTKAPIDDMTTQGVETRDRELVAAFRAGVAELANTISPNVAEWTGETSTA